MDDSDPLAVTIPVYDSLTSSAEWLVGLRRAWVPVADDDLTKLARLRLLPVVTVVEDPAELASGNDPDGRVSAMASSLFVEVQRQLQRYVAGELDLTDFRDWFTPATWGIEGTKDVAAYEIEHRLAEFTNGDWDEQELKQLLRPFAERRSEAASA